MPDVPGWYMLGPVNGIESPSVPEVRSPTSVARQGTARH